MSELEEPAGELRDLNELGELLQGCVSVEEANLVIERTVARLLPNISGGVYVMRASRNFLELTASWGTEANVLTGVLAPEDCWGMRRGRLHVVKNSSDKIGCSHIHSEHSGSLCIPMLAQGEVLGILHVIAPTDVKTGPSTSHSVLDSKRMLVLTAAEQIGLALSNLRLRDELKNQSIRDPLTGLYNRRFMEQTLEREIFRAAHANGLFSLISINLDHFRRLNDSFGHQGGDTVLLEVGKLLHDACTGSDLACRVGGEEFILIVPDKTAESAFEFAEVLRARFENLQLALRGRSLGKVTACFGVAEFPLDAKDADEISRAADVALYEAKNSCRNQTIVHKQIGTDKLVAPLAAYLD